MGYPVISRFYSHLRAGGFHPNPTGPSNIFQPTLIMSASTCHSTVSRRTYISKKKNYPEEQNSTPPDPAGRRSGRGVHSRPATASTTPPVADQVAASSPDQRQRAQPRRPRPVVPLHWLVHFGGVVWVGDRLHSG
jgi:hypothetical protein